MRYPVKELIKITVGTSFIMLGFISSAQGATLVVPNSLSNHEGNLFGAVVSQLPLRFQQVYQASEFGEKTLKITQISFRPDGRLGSAFSSTIDDIQINLSTTNAVPDGLSTNFADNIGVDETVVFNRGALNLSSANIGIMGEPKDFDVVINFTNPFSYNPKQGNLLLELKKFSNNTIEALDGQATFGDSVSTLFGLGDANLTIANLPANTFGFATKFTFTSIPESSSVLSLLTLGILGASYRLKQKLQ